MKGHKYPAPVIAPEKTKRDSNAIDGVYKGTERLK
jgi:hypothetical protein